MDLWFRTISDAARETFMTLIRGISPTEPILLLALIETPLSFVDPDLRAMFGYSLQNRVEVGSPGPTARFNYFKNALDNLNKAPTEFPDAIKKRKRVLEVLEKAPPPPPKVWTKTELDDHAGKDKQTINTVKIKLSGLMDLLKKKYQRFRKSVIDDKDMELLARGEAEPECLAHTRFRRNEDGMIREVTSNKKFYGMDLDQVNDRIWNGYYLTAPQFVFDIQCMVHDAKTWPDRDRTNRAEEMLVNTQTYISEVFDETLNMECQRMAEREYERQKIKLAEKEAKAKKKAEREKEKERLRLAAQAVQESQSPTKAIETAPTNEVQMLEANGDAQGLVTLPNGTNHEGTQHFDHCMVPESSPFTDQPNLSQSQPYATAVSAFPTPVHPYQPQPGAHPTYQPLIPQNYPQPQLTYTPYPPSFANISQPPSAPFPYPLASNSTSQTTAFYSQPAYAEPLRAISPPQYPPVTDTSVPMVPRHVSPTQHAVPFQPQNNQYHPAHSLQAPLSVHHLESNNLNAENMSPQRNTSPQRKATATLEDVQHPPLQRNPERVETLMHELTRKTDGFTLEQLEQVYAACMDVIWRLRHEWDRNVVIGETEDCAFRVMKEIEMMRSERQRDELTR
jgi:ATPase family AAA domain-containing protein 2